MGYFPVRYDSRVVNYDRRGFIRLATGLVVKGGDKSWAFCIFMKIIFSFCQTSTRKERERELQTGQKLGPIIWSFSILFSVI